MPIDLKSLLADGEVLIRDGDDPDGLAVAPLRRYNFSAADPLVEYSVSGAAAAFHLIAASGISAPYLIGLGVDVDGATGLVASVKADDDIGVGVTLESTSDAGSVGLLGQSFGPGGLVKLVKGSQDTGALLTLRADFGGTGRLLEWGVGGTSNVNGYIEVDGSLTIQHATSDMNMLRAKTTAGVASLNWYQWTGSPDLWFSSSITSSANSLLLQSGASAAVIGGESANTLIELKNGNSLGFFAATPVTKPTGVAVTAAGIHAALVSLGLIAA